MGQSTWINMRIEEKGNNVNLRRLLSKKGRGRYYFTLFSEIT